MSILKKGILPIIVIISCLALIRYRDDLSDFQLLLPAIILGVYLFFAFLYKELYKQNLNRKLTSDSSKKMPELRLVTNVLLFISTVTVIGYVSVLTLPVVLYPVESYTIEIGTDFEDVDFDIVVAEMMSKLDAEESEIILYDQFILNINYDKTINSLMFLFYVEKEEGFKVYFVEYKEGFLLIENNYYLDKIENRNNRGYIAELLPLLEDIALDETFDFFLSDEEFNIVLYNVNSFYYNYGTVNVVPDEENIAYYVHNDASKEVISEQRNFSTENHYAIRIYQYVVSNDGFRHYSNKTYTLVMEKEDSN